MREWGLFDMIIQQTESFSTLQQVMVCWWQTWLFFLIIGGIIPFPQETELFVRNGMEELLLSYALFITFGNSSPILMSYSSETSGLEISRNKICGGECDSCKFELNKNILLFSDLETCRQCYVTSYVTSAPSISNIQCKELKYLTSVSTWLFLPDLMFQFIYKGISLQNIRWTLKTFFYVSLLHT